jgi:hypothetical protein
MSPLYESALVLGLLVASYHAYLVWRLERMDAGLGLRAGLMLGLASIPFLVPSCWVHYFVFLPLLQGYVLKGAWGAGEHRVGRMLVMASVAVSAVLISVPLLLLMRGQPYYEGAWPFWATALLLPGLYLRVLGEARSSQAVQRQPG